MPASILHAASQGDASAVRECLAKFGGVVWSLARRHSQTQADAEDAAQEIFLDLWRSGARFDPERSSEVAFVAMLARRRLIDRARTRKRRPETEHLSPSAPFPVQARGEICVEASRAAKAMEALRPEQREVLWMSAVEGLSHEEIATARGIPIGTVKSHARRALIRVRQALVGDLDSANAVGQKEEPA